MVLPFTAFLLSQPVDYWRPVAAAVLLLDEASILCSTVRPTCERCCLVRRLLGMDGT